MRAKRTNFFQRPRTKIPVRGQEYKAQSSALPREEKAAGTAAARIAEIAADARIEKAATSPEAERAAGRLEKESSQIYSRRFPIPSQNIRIHNHPDNRVETRKNELFRQGGHLFSISIDRKSLQGIWEIQSNNRSLFHLLNESIMPTFRKRLKLLSSMRLSNNVERSLAESLFCGSCRHHEPLLDKSANITDFRFGNDNRQIYCIQKICGSRIDSERI